MFPHLFRPLTLGRIALPNRIGFMAHRTNFARHGRLDGRHLAYYRRRARGGCGLIVVGEFSIHESDRPFEAMIDLTRDEAVADLHRLTNAVHEYGTPIIAQLNHHGFQSSGAISRRPVWGPSAVGDIVFGEIAKPMEIEDMRTVTTAFANAAVTVTSAGFDGIEIDMGPWSLLRQFLSPISNHRNDRYGGDLENRLRLPLEVIGAVRGAVGKEVTIGVRLCLDEQFWGGISPEEGLQCARAFEVGEEIDYFSAWVGTYYNLYLSHGSMHTPPGTVAELAGRLKRQTALPVVAGHQVLTPQAAETVLANGQADLVGLVRALISDPDMPVKARDGNVRAIRFCLRDNKGCMGRVDQSKPLGCIQNPEVGFEGRTIPQKRSGSKRVLVVGAGPAGLEAARCAAERGHAVTVFEKNSQIGGQTRLHQLAAGREPIFAAIRFLGQALQELRVSVQTGISASAELVLAEKPDAVVVATGSRPIQRPYSGTYGPPGVLDVWQVLGGETVVGKKVLFIDEVGSPYALSVAEWLADQGKQLDLITCDLFVGVELAPLGDLYLARQRLLQKGVAFKTDVAVDRIDGALVLAREIYTNTEVLFEGYDTVVLAAGNQAVEGLYRQLKGRVAELYRAGDCVAPRGMDMAIFEGRRVGEML